MEWHLVVKFQRNQFTYSQVIINTLWKYLFLAPFKPLFLNSSIHNPKNKSKLFFCRMEPYGTNTAVLKLLFQTPKCLQILDKDNEDSNKYNYNTLYCMCPIKSTVYFSETFIYIKKNTYITLVVEKFHHICTGGFV